MLLRSCITRDRNSITRQKYPKYCLFYGLVIYAQLLSLTPLLNADDGNGLIMLKDINEISCKIRSVIEGNFRW